MKDLFLRGDTSIKPFFELVPWVFLLFIPAITMRVFADEKQTNSMELLLSLPITERTIVYAKTIVLCGLLCVGFVLTAMVPLSLLMLGSTAYTEIVVSYIGALLLGTSFISLGMMFSILTDHQLIAFISSCFVFFFLLVIGSDFLSTVLPRSIIQFMAYLSPLFHFSNFVRGIIDIRSVVYFALFIVFSLYICMIHLEKRT
jgi:ABC-2 type transport system permease protein